MDVNFIYSSEMTEKDIEEFNELVSFHYHLLDPANLENKTVGMSDYPRRGSFKIGQNVCVSADPEGGGAMIVCSNYTMFDNLALVAGETHEDRFIVQKIVKNWEAVKNFVEMLDS